MERNSTTYNDDPLSELWERFSPSAGLGIGYGEGTYSENDLIDAWNLGRAKGRLEYRQDLQALLYKEFIENMSRAAKLARDILAVMTRNEFVHYAVFLGTDEVIEYRMLIIVDEDSFVQEGFDEIYDAVHELIESEKTETFAPTINFVAVASGEPESLNIRAVQSDGYFYRLHDAS